MSRITGNVKWFDAKKGFGFIISPEGKDVFVHFSSIEGDGFRSLKDGEKVEYELINGEKGLHARNVVRLEPAATVTPSVQPGVRRRTIEDVQRRPAAVLSGNRW